MRLAAALLAFGLCFYFGCSCSRRLSARSLALREICTMLQGFVVKMRYTAPTFAELVDSNDGSFASIVRQKQQDGNIRDAWAAAAGTAPHLTEEARQLLLGLGKNLGTSAAEGQLSYLELCLSQAEQLSKAADAQQQRLCKLYRTVGALLGAAAAIMIV